MTGKREGGKGLQASGEGDRHAQEEGDKWFRAMSLHSLLCRIMPGQGRPAMYAGDLPPRASEHNSFKASAQQVVALAVVVDGPEKE